VVVLDVLESLSLSEYPETRESLLLKVKDPNNREAWEMFAQIYRPVIFRTARARGMQDADAHDLAQTVLVAVADAINRWEKLNESTKFRHWLSKVTKNAILNALTRHPKDRAVGGSDVRAILEETPSLDLDTEELIRHEYRRELYLRAAECVRRDVQPETWKAFELTAIEGRAIADVARTLGKPVGVVYTARSRVMLRLRDAVRAMEDDQ